jgi:hypothetical protein
VAVVSLARLRQKHEDRAPAKHPQDLHEAHYMISVRAVASNEKCTMLLFSFYEATQKAKEDHFSRSHGLAKFGRFGEDHRASDRTK